MPDNPGALAQCLRMEGAGVGNSRKAISSLGFGFHSVPMDWGQIQTPSRPYNKKTRNGLLENWVPLLPTTEECGITWSEWRTVKVKMRYPWILESKL